MAEVDSLIELYLLLLLDLLSVNECDLNSDARSRKYKMCMKIVCYS